MQQKLSLCWTLVASIIADRAVSVNATLCEIYSYRTDLAKSRPKKSEKGIIFTGGPSSAYLRIPLPSILKYILGVFRYWSSAMATS